MSNYKFTLVMVLLSFSLPGQVKADSVFGVVGDVPYGEKALALFPQLVLSIESSDIQFLIHVGDIKGGSAPCTDEMLSERVQAIDDIQRPVIFIPGDNDWTDCHRVRAGGFSPLERLAVLRSLAYPRVGESLGTPTITVKSQAEINGLEEFPEHQYWTENGTSFTSLHVLGSDNGLSRFRGRTDADDEEVKRRIAASIGWLNSSFDMASDSGSNALVVAIHGNPFRSSARRNRRYPIAPFAGLLSALYEGAIRFQKPVLLVHGDTHDYRFDQPIEHPENHPNATQTVNNIYRLEGIGSPSIGWVEVIVDTDSTEPFKVTPHFVED